MPDLILTVCKKCMQATLAEKPEEGELLGVICSKCLSPPVKQIAFVGEKEPLSGKLAEVIPLFGDKTDD